MNCNSQYLLPRSPMHAYHDSPELGAFLPSQEIFNHVVEAIASKDALGLSHDALEDLIEEETRPLLLQLFCDNVNLRGALEAAQAQLAETDAPVGQDGIERPHRRATMRVLNTIFGKAEIGRLNYTSRDSSGGLRPLDAQLNLPHNSYSFGVRKRACILAMDLAYGSATEKLLSVGGVDLGKRQMEELVERASMDFEGFYEQRHAQAAKNSSCCLDEGERCERYGGNRVPMAACISAAERCPVAACAASSGESLGQVQPCGLPCLERPGILVLSSDGKGIVMRKDSLREATRKKAEKSKNKLNSRLSSGEKKNRKRMAEVAAVYEIAPYKRQPEDVIDPTGNHERNKDVRPPRPVGKRVWASLVESINGVVDMVFDEAHYRDPEHRLTWVFLLDGNKDQIAAARRYAKRLHDEHGVTLHIVVDFIHVLEYLWKAVWCFFEKGDPAAEEWVLERAHRVLHGRAAGVARGMKQSATKRDLSEKERAGVDNCAKYLHNKRAYLRYDLYMNLGLPIATGVIEGACRHLVNDRFNITGARWGLAGAEAVLKLRALRSSGDFEEYWKFHRQREWERNHLQLYQVGQLELPRMSA